MVLDVVLAAAITQKMFLLLLCQENKISYEKKNKNQCILCSIVILSCFLGF